MTPIQRKKKIIDELQKKGRVEILELVEMLDVSAMTIRRDLDELEKHKKLIRTHGGATLAQTIMTEVSYNQKLSEARSQKIEIAEKAVSLIKEGMKVFLDSGTTNLEIARQLKSRQPLTIVTNDIIIAAELMDSEHELVLLGGIVQKNVGAVFGVTADEMLRNIHLDIAFIGAHAVHAKLGIMSTTFEKASLKKRVIDVSELVYLAVDSSKFEKKAFAKVAEVDSITGIITDHFLPEDIKELYKEYSIFIEGVSS
ncbi:DeoR/GlpR family DNA-binding transcription regulator [Lysinibacillus xylanilyticus]|uniref:DeoR/GlpR family DNA-binding transcription regulator n=1 Tax=Lysinibacillus xylanilyticus TaxID=582475 RepID=UPI00382E3413